jgi:hypothetical protein
MTDFDRALAAYRERISDLPLALRVLDRWRDNPDAQKSWDAIEQAAVDSGIEPPLAEVFIPWLIDQSLLFGRLTNEVIPRAPGMIQKAERSAVKQLKVNPAYAAFQQSAANKVRDDMARVLGRQPNPKKRFIQMCREMFVSQCGKPLDGVVATLTTVVFGENTTIDAVRGTQRASRRLDRDTRKRKN